MPPSLPLLVPPLLLAPGTARAAHPMATDDASTLGARSLEVEATAEAAAPSKADHPAHIGVGLSVHVGLRERLDLGVTLAYEADHVARTRWGTAMADPVLDLKQHLSDGAGPVPALALRLDYRAPRIAREAHSGHDAGILLIGTWTRDRLALDLNLGLYGLELGTPAARPSSYAAGALRRRVGEGVELGLEAVVEGADGRGVDAMSAMPALAWDLHGPVLSAGAGPTWSREEHLGWLATVGLTVGSGP